MTDGKPNRRISQLEKKVRELELAVSQPRQDGQAGVSEQTDASQKSQEAPGKAAIIPPTPPNPKSTKKNGSKRQPWWRRDIDRVKTTDWKKILETIGILAGVVYAILTYLQWHDLRHNFEADERAWIKVGYSWPDLTPNQIVVMNGKLVNFGKSTITWLEADGVLEVANGGDAPSFRLKGTHSTHWEAPTFPGDASSFPVRLYDQQTKQPRAFTAQELEDLAGGRSYVATFGWIAYRDQFGLHWYRFCSWQGYGTTGSVNASACVAWNRTGDGKPDVPIE